MPRPPISFSPALLLAAALLTASPALAQQYRGGGGTLLDRNQQVGSNGINARARDVRDQIWLNNAIITGNAASGKSFRGYVGYTAPSEFRGVAGSNDNYGFRRDSTSSAQVQSGVRASDALRYQLALTTGQNVPRYLSQVVNTPRDANAATADAATSTSAALRSTADYLTTRALRPTFVGSRTDADGREWNATASSLLGVSWLRVNKAEPKFDGPSPTEPTSDFAVPTQPTEKERAINARADFTPSGFESKALAMRYRDERERERPSAIDSAVNSTVVDRAALHAQLIDVLRTAYKPDADTANAASTDKPGDPARGEQADNKPKSFIDAELERVSRVLRGLPATVATKPDGRSPGEPTTTTPTTPLSSKPALVDPMAPTRSARKDDKLPDAKPIPPELIAALKAAGVKSLDSLVPREGILRDPKWYRGQMESGQQMLSEERYFDAEDRFTRAIAAMPEDPLAKIGRVHAQLGAGLFLSASANLRALLRTSPEVAGMRFEAKLLPSPARIAVVAGMLRTTLANAGEGVGGDTSLLLAYLGHITNDQPMCEEGLKALGERIEAKDAADLTLYQLIRAVWLNDQK